MGDRMVIVVELPQELGKVSALLSALGKAWPDTALRTLEHDELVTLRSDSTLIEIKAES